jgi:hypothetical protein
MVWYRYGTNFDPDYLCLCLMNMAHLSDLDEEEDGECDEAGAHIGELNGGDVGEESVPDLQESAPRIGHTEQSSQLGRDHLRGGKVI